MKFSIKSFFVFFAVGLLCFLPFGQKTLAAGPRLFLEGSSSYSGGEIVLKAMLNSEGAKICSIKAYLSFPSDILQVREITAGDRIFNVFVEKSFDNEAGEINVVAGNTGCTTSNANLFSVRFQAKEAKGRATVSYYEKEIVTVNESGVPVVLDSIATGKSFSFSDMSYVPVERDNINYPVPTSDPIIFTDKIITPSLTRIAYTQTAVFEPDNKRSKGIEFYGNANVNAEVTITIDNSNPRKVSSDDKGEWKFAYSEWLQDGNHSFSAQSNWRNQASAKLLTSFRTDSQGKTAKIGLNPTETPSSALDSVLKNKQIKTGVRKTLSWVKSNPVISVFLGIIILLAIIMIVMMVYLRKQSKMIKKLTNRDSRVT